MRGNAAVVWAVVMVLGLGWTYGARAQGEAPVEGDRAGEAPGGVAPRPEAVTPAAEATQAGAADAGAADAGAADAGAADAGTPAPAAEPVDSLEAILRQADALYAAREVGPTGPKQKQLEALLEKAQKAHPDTYEIEWRLARLSFWQADGHTDKDRKSALGRQAMIQGDRARALAPDRVEGHYFAAIGAGAWSQGMGILSALTKGIEGKFNERLDRAIALDADFDCGGPLLSKGRYFFELPWPKYDDEKSLEWLTRAVKACPERVRAWVYLAELHAKEDRDEKAAEALDKALSIEPPRTADPVESRRARRMAQALKESLR